MVSETLQLLRGNETSMRNGVVSSPKILNGPQGSVLSRTATLIEMPKGLENLQQVSEL